MKNKNPLFTIFTGTYNSEKIIDRVFLSLKKQTFRDFEWIVVDDCSKDDTIKKIEIFKQEIPDIDVHINIHQNNTGVSISRKEALHIAKGKYFVTWDHDDFQLENQLEIFRQLWEKYDSQKIGNIFAKIKDQDGNLLGKEYPTEPYLSDYINAHNDYIVGNRSKGNIVEHHVCAKTECYKLVLNYFEEHPNLLRGYNPNGGDVWGTLAYLGYNTIYTNQVVRKYYVNEEGRESMSDKPRRSGAERIYLNKLLWVNQWQKKLKSTSLNWTLRNTLAVGMYGFLSQLSLSQILKDVKSNKDKLLLLSLAFPAYLLSKRYQN